MRVRALCGYTLIELTIAISLLGLVAVLLWRFGSVASQRIAETEAPQLLAKANQALAGYVAANHRLPCPAKTVGGGEDCSAIPPGTWLPVVTLGLAHADLQSIHYGVYRVSAPNAWEDTDLAIAQDRFRPLVTVSTAKLDPGIGYDYGEASASETYLGNGKGNGIDFCHALRLAGIDAISTSSLSIGMGNKTLTLQSNTDFVVGHWVIIANTRMPSSYMVGKVTAYNTLTRELIVLASSTDGSGIFDKWTVSPFSMEFNIRKPDGAFIKSVAYALALPGARDADGNGNPFDGANVTTGSFAAPGQPLSATYDDVVHTVDFGQLFDRLSCAGVLSAADHAHFNAATAAALAHAAFVNYKTQLQIAEELAVANVLLATASVAMASADLLAATAGVTFSIAEALLSAGITAPVVLAAVWAETMALAAEALAIAGLAIAGEGLKGAKQTVLDFQPLLDQSATLETEIRTQAFAADAAGLY